MSENHHDKLGLHKDLSHGPREHVAHAVILKRAKLWSAVALVLLLVGAGATVATRVLHAEQLAKATEQNSRVFVSVIHAQSSANAGSVTLPSSLQGLIEAPIFARSTGYVVRWNKDIGSSVAKGEVLAEIDTPEVDKELAQAVAAKEQAASSLELAKSSAQRWEELRRKDAVTQQELDERRSAYTQATANFEAANANVGRLKKLEGFKNIVAPFSGVVTRRNVEVGDLIGAGSTGTALFTMAQVDPLRLYVYVPQAFSQQIKVGETVSISQTELADHVFQGKIVRTAGAIDVATRTLQVEIRVPNADKKLMAGSFVQVKLPVSGSTNALQVPSNVLLFRADGTQIAVVDEAGKVKLHTVKVGRDLGKVVEILSGINATDNLILNPPDSLSDNDVVTVKKPEPKKETEAGKAHS